MTNIEKTNLKNPQETRRAIDGFFVLTKKNRGEGEAENGPALFSCSALVILLVNGFKYLVKQRQKIVTTCKFFATTGPRKARKIGKATENRGFLNGGGEEN